MRLYKVEERLSKLEDKIEEYIHPIVIIGCEHGNYMQKTTYGKEFFKRIIYV